MKNESNMKDWGDFISCTNCTCDEHVNKCSCERKDIFHKDLYNKAMKTYYKQLTDYKQKNWFVRLFVSKPVEPNINWFCY